MPFVCPDCDNVLRLAAGLKMHWTTIHLQLNGTCYICGAPCRSLEGLASHCIKVQSMRIEHLFLYWMVKSSHYSSASRMAYQVVCYLTYVDEDQPHIEEDKALPAECIEEGKRYTHPDSSVRRAVLSSEAN